MYAADGHAGRSLHPGQRSHCVLRFPAHVEDSGRLHFDVVLTTLGSKTLTPAGITHSVPLSCVYRSAFKGETRGSLAVSAVAIRSDSLTTATCFEPSPASALARIRPSHGEIEGSASGGTIADGL